MALDVRQLLDAALREFSPDWEVVGECSPVDLWDSNQWPSGRRSLQVTLRHRATGGRKVLGLRAVGDAATSCHRGLAYLVLAAYGERNTDPIRRYFAEIGIVTPTHGQISSELHQVARTNRQPDGPPSRPGEGLIEQIRAHQNPWLVIVQRHHPALYRCFKEALAGSERAQVIIDRRFGARRQTNRTYQVERRRTLGDRRSRREIDADLRADGFAFVRLISPAAPLIPVQRPDAPAAAAVRSRRRPEVGVTTGRHTGPAALEAVLERLERILTAARRVTRAQAGTLYVRQGTTLCFTVVQNDVLFRRFGEEEMRRRLRAGPLAMNDQSLAGYVGLKGRALSVHDAYRIARKQTYSLDRALDERNDYRTVSVFLVPIHDHSKTLLGVLQLINALDSRGRPVPFRPPYGYVQRTLAARAANAIREATIAWAPQTVSPIGRRLGELLTASGLITPDELAKALGEQQRTKERLSLILVHMGLIGEDQLVNFLAQHYGIPALEFPARVDPGLVGLVPAEVARKYELVPVERRDRSLIVAMTDPTDLAAVDDVAFLTGLHVVPAIARRSLVRTAVRRSYEFPA